MSNIDGKTANFVSRIECPFCKRSAAASKRGVEIHVETSHPERYGEFQASYQFNEKERSYALKV